jgi:hypothetical protein
MNKKQLISIVVLISLVIASALSAIHTSASSPPKSAPNADCESSLFGSDLGTAGDVNGDGYLDVIVGAPGCDSGLGAYQGRAYVYYGSATGLSATPAWSFAPDKAPTYFGTSVGTAGDINGDGFDDVIVGAPRYNSGQGGNQGKVFVFYGSDSGLSATPDWTVISDQHPGDFGYSVGTAGDVNKDGYADVIVGCPSYTVDQTWEGRIFVYPGSKDGLDENKVWTVDGDNAYSRFGASVGTAGDVNKDGFDDVIVGAFQYGYPSTKGGAFVYYGSDTGIAGPHNWSSMGTQTDDARYGFYVATLGDVNGDSYDDIVVGEPLHHDGLTPDVGRIHVFYGSDTGPSLIADWIFTGEQAWEGLGFVSSAGDVNHDGYDDLIVGGAGYTPDAQLSKAGRARIFFGSDSGLSTTADWTVVGDQEDGYFGNAVGMAGDVDKNGYMDIIVGASHYDGTYTDEGRAYAYCGTSEGLSTTPCWTASPCETAENEYSVYLPLIIGP